jgi:hypothetical protein
MYKGNLQEEGKDKIARFLATLRDETGKLLPGIKELSYPDGGNYIGEVAQESIREGRGLYRYINGDVYFGGWRQEKFHGQGRYMFSSGETYQGELSHGLKEGVGTYYYNNGTYYSGNWHDDLKEGYGIYEVPEKQ